MAAMLAALVCVATIIIKVPSPLNGYINLGDAIVLLSGWLLSPIYAALAAGVGSMLADLFSGYAIYAPATLVIKGIMALLAYCLSSLLRAKAGDVLSKIIGGVVAEIWMVAGYFIFEGILYGFVPSLANIPANAVQGALGLVIALLLIKIFEKSKINLK